MLSRASIFATVAFAAGCMAISAAWAQVQNLEAGKSAAQLFASTCTACHKSPRGLMKTVTPGALSGFLREHYTTSGDMASQLSSYLISNGASDPRQAKQGSDKPALVGNDQAGDRQGRKNRSAPAQEAVRPDDGAVDGSRLSRRRLARPGEAPEDASAPPQAAVERAPDGRRLKRTGRAAQPGTEEPSALNEPARMEPPKADSAKSEPSAGDKAKVETQKGDVGMAEQARPNTDVKPGEAGIEALKDMGGSDKPPVRRDPVTTVVPPVATGAPSGGPSEPVAVQPKAAEAPPTVTASTPPSLPVQSGPPMPPISR